MPLRGILLFAACVFAAACEAAPQTETATDEVAALEAVRAYYVDHYNQGHGDMVAELYADSAMGVQASGQVVQGRSGFASYLAGELAASPQIEITTDDRIVVGDNAVARGSYRVRMAPDGAEPMEMGGAFLSLFTKVDGEWKIAFQITNFDAPPPDGYAYFAGENQQMPEQSTMVALIDDFVLHYNQGHAAEVAGFYTDDAFMSYGNMAPVSGRAAIEATLSGAFEAGVPPLEVHGVGTMELGEGWAVDGGWHASAETVGGYFSLLKQQPDGSWKIHWHVTNSRPRVAPAT